MRCLWVDLDLACQVTRTVANVGIRLVSCSFQALTTSYSSLSTYPGLRPFLSILFYAWRSLPFRWLHLAQLGPNVNQRLALYP